MAQFSFEDYEKAVNKAQNGGSNTSTKIGYFKLADGEEALIRFNISESKDLQFATVHKPAFGKKFEGLGSGFTPVSCLNELGSHSDNCPFCKAAAEGHPVISKASKQVYVQMLVAYKDRATGSWAKAIPVIWERAAGFSKEISTKILNYGNLRDVVFKITRTGTGKDTRYSIDFVPLLNKPELVPADFSAFNNFNIAKHSYWDKSAEELNKYLETGMFEDNSKNEKSDNMTTLESGIKVGGAPVFANAQEEAAFDAALNPNPFAASSAPAAPVETPVKEAPKAEEERPARNFNGFNFGGF